VCFPNKTQSYEYDGNQNLVKMTTPDGVTTYEYDPLDRLIKTTTPDGKSEHITYNGEGDVTSKTDKAGHKTSHVLDACGRIVETIDALGNSTLFEYDPMGRLTKTSLHRVDAQDKADEWEITLYEYDGRGLVTRETNALGGVTAYTYDGNGNLVSKTDADDYVTKYTYNALDFVTQINYNGGKQASYRYNKVGELVEMEDWTGTTSFEVDLLRRITQVTDRKGNVVEYGYDEVGNQVSMDYPDGTGVDYAYDLLHQLKTVTEDDGRTTAYTYDGMGRVVKMEYPHGWVEDYVYDSIGQLLRVDDTDPTRKDLKQQKHVYKYDDCGNMVYEYMRGNGTGEATTENTYTYDALHRITRADEVYGKAWREYQYDSLGNLTYESNSNNVHYDYKLNNLNQITQKSYSSNDKEGTLYTYDGRGNLVLEQYGKLNGNGNGQGNGQRSTVGQYTYDETNKLVLGVNSSGESSAYLYNGLGALVEDTWKIAKNGYGYHDVDAGLGDADPNNGRGGGGSNGQGNGNGNGQGNGNGSGDKPTGSLVTNFSTVVKEFVVDYTSPTFEPLMEHEVNGLDYRYVYGNDRLSVNITGVETSSGNLIENGNQIRLYYHMDYLGTADYLTSPVTGKVESWTHYNEWGEITHNAVLKSGKRELDLVKRYATHDYDAVLGMYYAKARFYDAENRRFAAVDPILDATQYDLRDYVGAPVELVQYIYVRNQPVILIDPDGYAPYTIKSSGSRGGYELFITPYLLDSFIYGAGWIPGFSQAYDFLDWAILGAIKINASKEYLESLGMSVADHFFDDLHIGDAYNFVNGLKLLESLEDVPMNEALQNHFASKVWRSSTRKLVEEKYFTAISILSALIESGDVEIKKTEEVFNESDFTSAEILGRHVYAYDSFMGRKEIFLPGHYYFFLVCKEKEGIGAEIESILKDIK
jgi:RHS repeat-associated protein